MSRIEWLRDLVAAERELGEAKTAQQVRAIQIRIKEIKRYIALNEVPSLDVLVDLRGMPLDCPFQTELFPKT